MILVELSVYNVSCEIVVFPETKANGLQKEPIFLPVCPVMVYGIEDKYEGNE